MLNGVTDVLRTTDGGWFGAGAYLTPEAEYAAKYATGEILPNGQPYDANKTYCIILCAALVGLTYPITRTTDYITDTTNQNDISVFHYAYPAPIAGHLDKRTDKALKAGFDSHFIAVRVDKGYQVKGFLESCDICFYSLGVFFNISGRWTR